VGAGLIAEDLKARALPLYLVRPVTPFDYWLGKLLVPVRVLAVTVLAPGLALILIGALFQPSERMLPFLWDRRGLVVAVVLHWAYVALVWSSLALFVSAVARGRGAAIVLGGILFFAGVVSQLVASHLDGRTAELLHATSLYQDGRAVLGAGIEGVRGRLPEVPDALLVGGAVVLLAAGVVVRRARTVEVVA
jgi:hypothetical protein